MNFKRYLSILSLSVAALSIQPIAVHATTNANISLSQATTVPSEVLAAESYVEVPVYFNGEIAQAVTTYLEKRCNVGNANEVFISGYATVSLKAYAYKTGSNIKVGATITYLNKDGNTVTDWWDNIEQFYSVEEAESAINWPICTQYALNLNDNIVFEMPNQNENDLRLSLTLTGIKSSFTRPTNQGVALSEEYPTTPEETTPEVDAPEVDAPEVDAPEVDAPEVDAPEVDDFDNASGLDPEYF